MARRIDYGNLMHRHMRKLIQQVLEGVAAEGLPADHHFFITFDTMHPDVEIADWLSDRYPGEMTVVMQHWFDNLTVTDDGFSVTLNFGNSPEPLYIPWDAIKTFVDPSVEFGLRFEAQEDGSDAVPVAQPTPRPKPKTAPEPKSAPVESAPEAETDAGTHGDAEVVSLDKFRKH